MTGGSKLFLNATRQSPFVMSRPMNYYGLAAVWKVEQLLTVETRTRLHGHSLVCCSHLSIVSIVRLLAAVRLL